MKTQIFNQIIKLDDLISYFWWQLPEALSRVLCRGTEGLDEAEWIDFEYLHFCIKQSGWSDMIYCTKLSVFVCCCMQDGSHAGSSGRTHRLRSHPAGERSEGWCCRQKGLHCITQSCKCVCHALAWECPVTFFLLYLGKFIIYDVFFSHHIFCLLLCLGHVRQWGLCICSIGTWGLCSV